MDFELRKRVPLYNLGKVSTLSIQRLTSVGAYLDCGTEDILLPNRYLPDNPKEGDQVEAFIYHDNDGRLIATTLHPLIQVGEVAMLKTVSVSEHGAFMEWGIHRDLFVPFAEQNKRIEKDEVYAVYAYVDDVSGKIVGSTKLNKHIGNLLPTYQPGDTVQALVYMSLDHGYRAVVDNTHWGMIYRDGCPPGGLQYGDELTAYVVRIRDDGKIDLSLDPVGYTRIEPEAERIMELIRVHNGVLPIGDKSSPADIKRLTGLSKKAFKMAVGHLYKERVVLIGPESVRLRND